MHTTKLLRWQRATTLIPAIPPSIDAQNPHIKSLNLFVLPKVPPPLAAAHLEFYHPQI